MRKTGFFKALDQVILIDADDVLRKEKVMANRGMSSEDYDNRVRMQLSNDEIIKTLNNHTMTYTLFRNDYTKKMDKRILDYLTSNKKNE